MDNAGDDRGSLGIGGFLGRSRNSRLSSSFFLGTIQQFHERGLSVANYICSNTFQEPGVAELSSRDVGFPRILVRTGQRTENHFG